MIRAVFFVFLDTGKYNQGEGRVLAPSGGAAQESEGEKGMYISGSETKYSTTQESTGAEFASRAAAVPMRVTEITSEVMAVDGGDEKAPRLASLFWP